MSLGPHPPYSAMADNDEQISLRIQPLGQAPFTLSVPPSTLLSDLRDAVASRLGGGRVRLLFQGQQLLRGTLDAAGLQDGSALTVLRTSEAAVSAVRALREDRLLRPFGAPTPRYVGAPRASARGPSLFGSVEALAEFADWRAAERILRDLADDAGFHAAMARRGWRVGKLAEMYPAGRVGVDPVCVLGYNVGRGQEIRLRLRTDDLAGFRPLRKIRQVLAHELAHNTHSDHGPEFKQLMLDVEREADAKDWTQSRGRVVGDAPVRAAAAYPGRPAAAHDAPPAASAAASRLIREDEARKRRARVARPADAAREAACPARDAGGGCDGCNSAGGAGAMEMGNETATLASIVPEVQPAEETRLPEDLLVQKSITDPEFPSMEDADGCAARQLSSGFAVSSTMVDITAGAQAGMGDSENAFDSVADAAEASPNTPFIRQTGSRPAEPSVLDDATSGTQNRMSDTEDLSEQVDSPSLPPRNAKPEPAAKVPPEVEALGSMGFGAGMARLALRESGNDVMRAADWILANMTGGQSEPTRAGDDTIRVIVDALSRLEKQTETSDKFQVALDTIHVYVSNVLRNPQHARYREINSANAQFRKRIAQFEAAVEILKGAGFQSKPDDQILRLTTAPDMAKLWTAKTIVQERLILEFQK